MSKSVTEEKLMHLAARVQDFTMTNFMLLQSSDLAANLTMDLHKFIQENPTEIVSEKEIEEIVGQLQNIAMTLSAVDIDKLEQAS